jgi:plastocyanin domain-containing protein
MNMFRGVVEVQSGEPTATTANPVSEPVHHVQHLKDLMSSTEATLAPSGVQEATITVAKGYQPKRVIVEAGHPVRLKFDRQNPSSCYDQLLIPDFAIAVDLNSETTTVEFTPEQVGEYEFMCGMKMNRGAIEVRPKQLHSQNTAQDHAHA